MYVPQWIPADLQRRYIAELDAPATWSRGLDRLTQHFGARYDYKTRKLVYDVPPLTSSYIVDAIARALQPNFTALNGGVIDQCIVNDYRPKQRITAHTDSPLFGPVIATVSLGSATVMRFTRPGYKTFDVILNGGDVVFLTGESRTLWKHELLPVNKPSFRRVSLTFRHIE